MAWVVHKFGGTSVANVERYQQVAGLLAPTDGFRQAVVVSAMGGMTDRLFGLVKAAAERNEHMDSRFGELRDRLLGTVGGICDGVDQEALTARITADLADIGDVLRATRLLGKASREVYDLVSGYGELWSAQLLCTVLRRMGRRAYWLDARKVLTVQWGERPAPDPDMVLSQQQLDAWLEAELPADCEVLVITGYVAVDPSGIPTTLGRNGSDFSGAIFAALLGAEDLTIWTDVDGVLSADPRIVPEAVILPEISYQEAMELAYFGAKVLHPSTIAPIIARSVRITIKNTFNPDRPGTRIGAHSTSDFAVKGFATIDGMALVNLEGTHMIGVPGIAQRLFGALREAAVSVVMISQGSSEHSICFVVPDQDADRVRLAVEQAFFAERHQGAIMSVGVHKGCSILAAVGDQMAGQVGLAARFFQALGDAHVNVRAIAQGASERNISVVVAKEESGRALRAVHSAFTLSRQTLSIGLIGAGSVGKVLMTQIAAQRHVLRDRFNLDLRVRAIADSKTMLLHDKALDLDHMDRTESVPLDLAALVAHVNADHLPHAVLVDCTASSDIAHRYHGWLSAGIHVVTPNKKANTGPLADYEALRAVRGAHYLYETTVGAGLPVLHTLRDLVQTGDVVERIDGILSGTLSYLFNAYDGRVPFSELVKRAWQLGYTEPDPRDDLSGIDVARKIVILGREAGIPLLLSQVAVTGLSPDEFAELTVDGFIAALPALDAPMRERLEEARSKDCVLRMIGRVDRTGASVGLEAVPQTHAFARIQLTDNIVQFTTARYSENPLVVQGPGAGPEVTAAGIFADLLRLSSYLGTAR